MHLTNFCARVCDVAKRRWCVKSLFYFYLSTRIYNSMQFTVFLFNFYGPLNHFRQWCTTVTVSWASHSSDRRTGTFLAHASRCQGFHYCHYMLTRLSCPRKYFLFSFKFWLALYMFFQPILQYMNHHLSYKQNHFSQTTHRRMSRSCPL
jgi:hypothetical protein